MASPISQPKVPLNSNHASVATSVPGRGRTIRFGARLWTLELKESVNHLDRIINMTGKSRISICMK